MREDRRLEKVPVRQSVAGRPSAARDELSFAPADLDVGLDLVHCVCVDEGPNLRGRLQAVPQPEAGRPPFESAEQVLEDRLLNDHPATRGAALAPRSERRTADPV